MIGKKINQLATELAPTTTDLTIIGDPVTGVSKKITLEQLGAIFGGAVSFYTNLASFPATGVIDIIYCAKDTQKLYLWSGSAYVEVFPSQALLDTYQLRSEKGNANGYASLDSLGKVPISQLPSSIMEYKGTWNAATNTPTLANGTGDTGDVYICNVAGTVNFGAGAIAFAVGDYVIYSGTIWQRSSGAVGTVTSVAASITGNSVSISGSPIVTSGTLAFSFAGNATQYVRGDGQLATLPTNGGGGGASVSYYLNGSINQGTIGGVTYYEMNKTPIIGAGTDFTRNSNGYIASFLTDANDPALLNIPAGNFNFETYFQASSGGGSPTFYIELYKYDGTTFTLIASNSGTPKLINDGTNIEAYFSALAVPQTTLTLTDRLAIRIYVTTAGRTITLHTENGHLCQVITTFTTGLTALNGLTAQVQYLATGTSGTDFNIASASATHTFNLPTASATNRGALSSADFTTFNNKQNALTLTTTGSSGASTLVGATLNIPNYTLAGLGGVPTSRTLTINGTAFDLSADRSWSVGTVTSVAALTIGTSGTDLSSTVANGTTTPVITLNVPTASATNRGALSSTDWTTFNNKQNALTNPVTGTGTTNYLPKFTGTSTIGNSILLQGTNNTLSNVFSSATGTQSFAGMFTGQGASGNTGIMYFGAGEPNGLDPSYPNIRAGLKVYQSWNGSGTNVIFDLFTLQSGVGNNTVLTGLANGNAVFNYNLGLGVTPSAWFSGTKALQISGGSMYASTTYTFIGSNIIYTSAGDQYINTGAASVYGQVSGEHRWYNAPSGTAGTAMGLTQAMTLNASGNLSIGNTNDTFKLDVTGTGRFGASTYKMLSISDAGGAGWATTGGASTAPQIYMYSTGTSAIVQTYINNTARLEVTNTGISVTGAATFSSSVTAGVLSRIGDVYIGGRSGTYASYTDGVFGDNLHLGATSVGGAVYINTALSRNLIINPVGGNVGIGTTNPGGKLNVFGAKPSITSVEVGVVTIDDSTSFAAGVGGSLLLRGNYRGLGDQVGAAGIEASKVNSTDGDYGFNMLFYTRQNGSSLAEKMRITSGGNVEINTGSIKTGEPDTGWGRAAIKIGASVSGAAFDVTRYLPVSVDGTVYYINLNSSTP
jgi:hypothetical protein